MVHHQDEQVANSNNAMASSSSSEKGCRDDVAITVHAINRKNSATATKENIAPNISMSPSMISTLAITIQDDDNSQTKASGTSTTDLPFNFVQSKDPRTTIPTTASRVSIDNSTSSPSPSPSLFFDEEITIQNNNNNDDDEMPPPPPRRERSTSASLLITSPAFKKSLSSCDDMKLISSLSPSCNTEKCTAQDATAAATTTTTLVTPSPISAQRDLNIDSGHLSQSNSSSLLPSKKSKVYLNSITTRLIDLNNDTDTGRTASSQEVTSVEQHKNSKSTTAQKKISKCTKKTDITFIDDTKKIDVTVIDETTPKNQEGSQKPSPAIASSHQQKKEHKRLKCRRARAKIVSYAEKNSSEDEEENVKSDGCEEDYVCKTDNGHTQNQSSQEGRSSQKTRARVTKQNGLHTKTSTRSTKRRSSSNKTNATEKKKKVTEHCRKDMSLKTIGKEFYRILEAESKLSTCVDLNAVATQLRDQCHKRRIYDVLNVLEGAGLVEKTGKNRVRFVQNDHNMNKKAVAFMKRNEELQREAQKLDKWIEKLQQQQPQKSTTKPNRLNPPEKEIVSSPSNNTDSLKNHRKHFMYMNAADLKHGLPTKNSANSTCLVLGGTHYKEAASSSKKKRKKIENDDNSHHFLSIQSKPSLSQKIFSVDYGTIATPTLKPFHFLIPPPSLLESCNSSFTIKALCATRPAGREMMGASLPPSIQELQSPIELTTRPSLTLPVASQESSSLSTSETSPSPSPSPSPLVLTTSPLVSRHACTSNGSFSAGKHIPTIPLSREDPPSTFPSSPSDLCRGFGSTRSTVSSHQGKQLPIHLSHKKSSTFSPNPHCIPSPSMEEEQQTSVLASNAPLISAAATSTIASNHNLLPQSCSWFSPSRGTHRTSQSLGGVGAYESTPFSSSNLHNRCCGSPIPTISRTIAMPTSRGEGIGEKSPHPITATFSNNDTTPAQTLPEVTPTGLLSPFSAAAIIDFMDMQYTTGEGSSTTILPPFHVSRRKTPRKF